MTDFFSFPQQSLTDEFIPVDVNDNKKNSTFFQNSPKPSTSTQSNKAPRFIEKPLFETDSFSFDPIKPQKTSANLKNEDLEQEEEIEKAVEILSKPRVEIDSDEEVQEVSAPKPSKQEKGAEIPKPAEHINIPINTPEPQKALESPTINRSISNKNPDNSQLGTPMPRFASPQKKATNAVDSTSKSVYFLWDLKKIVTEIVTYKNIGFSFFTWLCGIATYYIVSKIFFQDVGLHNRIYVLSLLFKRFTSAFLILIWSALIFLLGTHFLKFVFYLLYCGWRQKNAHVLESDAPLRIPSIKLLIFPIVDFACEIFDISFSWYLEALTFRPTREGYFYMLQKMFLAFFTTSILYLLAINLRFHTFLLISFFMLMTLPIMFQILGFVAKLLESILEFVMDSANTIIMNPKKVEKPKVQQQQFQTSQNQQQQSINPQPQQYSSLTPLKESSSLNGPQTPMSFQRNASNIAGQTPQHPILTPTPIRVSMSSALNTSQGGERRFFF